MIGNIGIEVPFGGITVGENIWKNAGVPVTVGVAVYVRVVSNDAPFGMWFGSTAALS